MTIYDLFIGPFADYAFMRRALVASLALGLGCAPVGVWLVLRRMSLVGDAMSHALLPGAAVGFLLAGLSLPALSVGGLAAGILVAVLSGLVTRWTPLREDASFAAFYLISLAIGVTIVSAHGSNIDLMRFLFGSVLAVDDDALTMVAAISSVTVVVLVAIHRPLVIECFDPEFLKANGARGGIYHVVFLLLVVINLVAAFQALGTLMAVGLMMIPAAAARLWAGSVARLCFIAALMAATSGYCGLVVSYHVGNATGPSIVMASGAFYLISLVFGTDGGLVRRWTRARHLEA
ncbi:MAG: metal ABC transporter permease [Alphaproteobacteria bacterium]|nr:metal ABC transporter permease [Alphaproteobacteria bacterium]